MTVSVIVAYSEYDKSTKLFEMLGPQLNCAFSLPIIDSEKNKINRTLNLFKMIVNLIFLCYFKPQFTTSILKQQHAH